MTLEEFIKQELTTESPSWFDSEGNSPRAHMLRWEKGYWYQCWWCTKDFCKELKHFFKSGDFGLNLTIGELLAICTLPFTFPFIPFTRTHYTIKRARKDYSYSYKDFMESKVDK